MSVLSMDRDPCRYLLSVTPRRPRRLTMSKVLSLKLQEQVYEEAEEILRSVRRARNAYFNEAIHFYNKLWKRKLLKRELARESALVAADSLEVLERPSNGSRTSSVSRVPWRSGNGGSSWPISTLGRVPSRGTFVRLSSSKPICSMEFILPLSSAL
jgi:hypothetical protein